MDMLENNMTKSFDKKLIDLLKTDSRFVDDEGELIKAAVIDRAWKIDRNLVKLLLSEPEIEKKFFDEIEGHWIFNINTFIEYISDKNFLANSYTRFRNKVGLNIGGKFLRERGEVSLVWPYKDCVLEGGQTKGEEKRKEIFFNEILAQDEIDRLFDPKVLTNFKRYTPDGEQKVREIKRDENSTIRENLIIKGNNLLALHTLKTQFRGKVKLIYIDPPYNTGNDSFGYNDNFNHSSWLTFMKNRLEVARELLHKSGAIFVQIDHHEFGYINILMDDIYGKENKVQLISLKTASPAGFKTVNPGPIDVTEYILFYTKSKKDFKFKKSYTKVNYHKNYNLVIVNKSENPEKWILKSIKEVVLDENGIEFKESLKTTCKQAEKKWGKYWKIILNKLIADYALRNSEKVVSIRDPHKPTNKLKLILNESKKQKNKIFIYKKSTGCKGDIGYVINGGALAFYSNKIKNVDGKLIPTELLTDFWNDISWAGIAKEGGVRLKNGKKPEKLIQRIIEMATKSNDIVMDYHMGSGTTAAAAHKMGRQYIGIEQLDYEQNDSAVRLQNLIGKRKKDGLLEEYTNYDQTGISKSINWQGGGDFIYCELMKYNEAFMDKIQSAKTSDELLKIWKDITKNSFLNWYVNPEMPEEAVNNFIEIGRLENGLEKQQKLLAELLNKNQLYVNLSEIDDEDFKVSEEDKKLNQSFYGEAYND